MKITELNHPVCETKQEQNNPFSNFSKAVDVKFVQLAMKSQYTVTPEMMWPICQNVTPISIMAKPKENVIYRIAEFKYHKKNGLRTVSRICMLKLGLKG